MHRTPLMQVLVDFIFPLTSAIVIVILSIWLGMLTHSLAHHRSQETYPPITHSLFNDSATNTPPRIPHTISHINRSQECISCHQ